MSIIKVRNEEGVFVEIPTLQGPQGDTGIGIPTGGTTGQILSKNSDSDYDTRWIDNNSGSGGTSNYNELLNKPITILTGNQDNPITHNNLKTKGLYMLNGNISLPLGIYSKRRPTIVDREVYQHLILITNYLEVNNNLNTICGIYYGDYTSSGERRMSSFKWLFSNGGLVQNSSEIYDYAYNYDIPTKTSQLTNDSSFVTTEQLNTKLDKNQGSENSGKYLSVSEDGDIVFKDISTGGTNDYNELINKPIIDLVGTNENPIKIDAFTETGIYRLNGRSSLPFHIYNNELDVVSVENSNTIYIISGITQYPNGSTDVSGFELSGIYKAKGFTTNSKMFVINYFKEGETYTYNYNSSKIVDLNNLLDIDLLFKENPITASNYVYAFNDLANCFVWTGDVNNIDVFDEIYNTIYGETKLNSRYSLYYYDRDDMLTVPMSLIPDLESSPPNLKCLFQGQYINKNQETVSLSSTITYTMDSTGNFHCSNITPMQSIIVNSITSSEVKRIEVVDVLPEVEEEGVLYLIKEQVVKENLYYQNEKKDYTSSSGINYIFDIDKTITLNGTPTNNASTYSNNFNVNFDTNKTYKLKLDYISGDITRNATYDWKVYLYYNNEEPDHEELCSSELTDKNNLELTFKPNRAGDNIYGIRVYVYSNNVYNNLKYNVSIEEV